jgi:DNA-binding NarL/FixJ family response regulator
VKIHVQHILRKLGVSSRLQAALAVTGGGLRY